jgi:hypothetical protein
VGGIADVASLRASFVVVAALTALGAAGAGALRR